MNKICYVVTISITIKSFFIPQLKYLADNGYDVTVICSTDNELQSLLGPTVKYVPIDIPRGISIMGMTKAIINLIKFFKIENFDLVQYSTPNAGLCAAVASKITDVKIRNYHLMGLRYLGDTGLKRILLKSLEKVTCKLSTHIECVSNSNLKLALSAGLFPAQKATVVFNGSSGGINLKRFDYNKRDEYREKIRNKYTVNTNEFVFGFVGRITRDKGVNEIFQAFSKLSDCTLMMIGFTDEVDTLDKELYNDSLSNSRIIYTGPVNDVEKYYAAIDCLLLPSYREGFGNVLIEAAAMGTPAIVSKIPGPIDASEENITAIQIEPQNTIELEQAMCNMKKIANKMQDNCILFATQKFDQNLLNIEIKNRKDTLLGKT